MSYLIEVECPQNYWWDFEQSSSWNFTLNKHFLVENKDSFLDKFISIGVKYGIIIPAIDPNYNLVEGVNLLKRKVLEETEISFRTLFYRPFFDVETNRSSIKSDMYINSEKNISMKRFDKYSNSFNLFDIQIVDKFRLLFYTDAFFSELHNRKVNFKSVSNKELIYLNTTRLNSYVRDLLVLMLQYESVFDFENGFETIDVGNKSIYFKDMFLLVNDEVLFYEDVYDLLADEHKYKPFEEIQVELDNTNYKKYLESSSEDRIKRWN